MGAFLECYGSDPYVPYVNTDYEGTYTPPLGPPNPKNPVVYFDIEVSGTYIGRIEFELKADVVPRTAENFRSLCVGDNPSRLSYLGVPFHRIIPGFMCQGGDITRQNGTGGMSIYGLRMADENFRLKHAGPGILSMANSGPDSNSSQFFICVRRTAHLDGKHVVFGQVLRGYSVVKAIEMCGSGFGFALSPVRVRACGIMASRGKMEGRISDSSDRVQDKAP
eukprot:g303.t1